MLTEGLMAEIEGWRTRIDRYQRRGSSVRKDENSRSQKKRQHILPQLKETGLDWVNFQVMRRTHSSLMKHLKGAGRL